MRENSLVKVLLFCAFPCVLGTGCSGESDDELRQSSANSSPCGSGGKADRCWTTVSVYVPACRADETRVAGVSLYPLGIAAGLLDDKGTYKEREAWLSSQVKAWVTSNTEGGSSEGRSKTHSITSYISGDVVGSAFGDVKDTQYEFHFSLWNGTSIKADVAITKVDILHRAEITFSEDPRDYSVHVWCATDWQDSKTIRNLQ